MTKRASNKFRICRQVGEDLWGMHASKTFQLETSPGEHGKVHRKVKDTRYEPKYLTQLREKQKMKKYYGELTESQFASLFEKGMKLKGEVFQNLFSVLERRLDAVVYRMGFVSSIFEARQFINHGHVLVNDVTVTVSSYSVQNLDLISIVSSVKDTVLKNLQRKTSPLQTPPYIEVDASTLRAVFLRAPLVQEIPYTCEMNMRAVIQYYSR